MNWNTRTLPPDHPDPEKPTGLPPPRPRTLTDYFKESLCHAPFFLA